MRNFMLFVLFVFFTGCSKKSEESSPNIDSPTFGSSVNLVGENSIEKVIESEGIFKSKKGYSIRHPEGWEVASPYLSQEEIDQLPEYVVNGYNKVLSDAMFVFYDETVEGELLGDFISVAVIDQVVPLTDDVLKGFKKGLLEDHPKELQNFELIELLKVKAGDNTMFRVKSKGEIEGYEAFMYMFLAPGKQNTILISCVVTPSRHEHHGSLCEAAAATVKFD